MVKIISNEASCPTNRCIDHFHPHFCPCTEQEYVLSCGANIKLEAGEEVQHDFILEKSSFKDCGTINGTVKDAKGNVIHNALVKVFDCQHRPITHVFTNREGQFLICLPPGSYIIKAVK